MKRFPKNKLKKGAASFYIVAFSTLILVIIVASFTAVIISEITRTSNDDLAQSAYDSALAGVEDAKLAVYNYQSCLEDSSKNGCSNILGIMENPDKQCTMVADILGRPVDQEEGKTEVMISETKEGDNNMQQAYTCVIVDNKVPDVQGTLSSEEQMKVIKAKFDTKNNIHADMIKEIKINWYGDNNDPKFDSYTYKNGTGTGTVTFPSLGTGATPENAFWPAPPIISVGMIQTAEQFTLNQFDKTIGDRTNRGMVYLVPAKVSSTKPGPTENNLINNYGNTIADNYISAYKGSGQNYIGKGGFNKSNDKVSKNYPYVVGCDRSQNSYACSTIIELPEPIDGPRSDNTFTFVVSLPYGGPSTQFSLEFICGSGVLCSEYKSTNGKSIAEVYNVQIEVDSTGRANSLYKRVEARLEPANEFSLSILGPLEILGSGDNTAGLDKSFYTTCEYNFGATCF